MTQTIGSNRGSVALVLVAMLLVAVAAGAFMLTCVEDAHASESSSPHTGGTACDLHEGHTAPDAVTVTLPDRSGASDMAVSVDAASFQYASSERVEASDSSGVPLSAADPLCGRLLL